MNAKKFPDILGVSVEHMVSDRLQAAGAPAGLVKLRVELEGGQYALAQLAPATAREIALHLMSAAARAEYEGDVFMAAASIDQETVDTAATAIARLARAGEYTRETKFGAL